MKCPSCGVQLVRVTYEGLPVFRCEYCFGYLLGRKRMEGIQRTQRRSTDELEQEAVAENRGDSEQKIRCPRCRKKMRKEFLKEPASFHTDTCVKCQLIWFDGGELARLQLRHEIRPQAREAAELERRHREMSPERRAEFEQNLAKLPEPESPLEASFKEAVVEALFRSRRSAW